MKLFEDIFDGIDSKDIVPEHEHEIMIEPEQDYDPEYFQHHVDYRITSDGVFRSEVGFMRIIDRIFPKYISNIRYLSECKIMYYDHIDKKYVDDLKETYNTGFEVRLMFNLKTVDFSLYKIFYLLKTFYKIMLMLQSIKLFNVDGRYYIDGNYRFSFTKNEYDSIANQSYVSKTSETQMKHFVRIFNSTKAIANDLDKSIDKYNDFRGTNSKERSFMTMFCSPDDYKNCTIILNKDDYPTIVIPEGKTVNVHLTSPMYGRFKVQGTLVVHNSIYVRDSGSYVTKNFFDTFYKGITHNRIIVKMVFQDSPYFKGWEHSSNIDMNGLKVKRLEIVADDMFIEDVEELEKLVSLSGAENVKNVKYNVEEITQ